MMLTEFRNIFNSYNTTKEALNNAQKEIGINGIKEAYIHNEAIIQTCKNSIELIQGICEKYNVIYKDDNFDPQKITQLFTDEEIEMFEYVNHNIDLMINKLFVLINDDEYEYLDNERALITKILINEECENNTLYIVINSRFKSNVNMLKFEVNE